MIEVISRKASRLHAARGAVCTMAAASGSGMTELMAVTELTR